MLGQVVARGCSKVGLSDMSELVIADLECRYGSFAAVSGFNLNVASGEFVSFLGPSGSGKTTVLRAIGGYHKPAGGKILIDGQDVTRLAPQRRNIGMVFQDLALFPHMRVFDNVAYGLRVRKTPRKEIRRRVLEALEIVELPDMERRYPHELSGGQQQRVALARAIVIRPALLLMDEPLGALDLRLRESMQTEIKRIQRALGITAVYVTHDQIEAFTMSDRVVVLNRGSIVSVGTPEELYLRPSAKFTAEFVGQVSILPVEVASWDASVGTVRVAGQTKPVRVKGPRPPEGHDVFLTLRPEKIRCSKTSFEEALQGQVTSRRFTGMNTILTIRMGNADILALDRDEGLSEGDAVFVSWATEDAHLLLEATESET